MWHDKILVALAQSHARGPTPTQAFASHSRMQGHVDTFIKQSKQTFDCDRHAAHFFSRSSVSPKPILSCALISTFISGVHCATPLTSAETSHTHVVGGYDLLLDREVVRLQRVEGRVPEDDGGVVTLVLECQQFLRADGMKRLVGLCDEAGL